MEFFNGPIVGKAAQLDGKAGIIQALYEEGGSLAHLGWSAQPGTFIASAEPFQYFQIFQWGRDKSEPLELLIQCILMHSITILKL